MKNILIAGGDGFCGWPTVLETLSRGHKVVIGENLTRRRIDAELRSTSITPIETIENRIKIAKEVFNNSELYFEYLDFSKDYDDIVRIIKDYDIDTIVHFAEIKSAPYSMMSAARGRHTVDNNINGTTNILTAIVHTNPNIHLVHLGTMGVYGYKDDYGKIPEGYLDIQVKSTGADTQILWPTDPGSIYHVTKSLDQILFQFYNKNWGIKVTDLHQGIVWGTQTRNTTKHDSLVNRFDYDAIWGTVLNRFIVEAAINYPLTVHGTGGQTRAFIHIQDSADCIRRSVENPPESNRVRIFNQVAETKTVIDLAKMISEKTGVDINYQQNPRKERAENSLEVENHGLKSLGFHPTLLEDSLVNDVLFIAEQFKNNINANVIDATPYKWVK